MIIVQIVVPNVKNQSRSSLHIVMINTKLIRLYQKVQKNILLFRSYVLHGYLTISPRPLCYATVKVPSKLVQYSIIFSIQSIIISWDCLKAISLDILTRLK